MRAIVIVILLALVPRPADAQRLALEWLGHDADKVSRDETAAPDGFTDLHYRLVIRLDRPASIRSIVLRPIDGDGQPIEDYGYGTADSTGPLLAVEREGEPLNAGFTNSLGEMEGETRLDLYTEDFGTIDTGSRIRVEVAIEGRPTVTGAFTL